MENIKAMLMTDETMGSMDADDYKDYSLKQLVYYLEDNPRHAVHIGVGEDLVFAVWRGAGEALDNFFHQELPLEDPGDANGGGLTAEQALKEALGEEP